MEADSTPTMTQDHWAALAQVTTLLGDDVEPVFEYDAGDIPTGWVDEDPIEFPYEAHDNGLGILYTIMVSNRHGSTPWDDGGAFVRQWDPECVGNTQDPCPLDTPANEEFVIETDELREGHNSVQMAAVDAGGNYSVENEIVEFDLDVDTVDPAVELSGSFTTAPGMVLTLSLIHI